MRRVGWGDLGIQPGPLRFHAHPLAVLSAAGILATGALSVAPRSTVPISTSASAISARVQEFPEVPYDGRYTFVRIAFDQARGGMRSFGGFGGRGRGPAWAHDYPRAEANFAKILEEVTLLDPYMGGSRILRMDDPEIFKYPVLYVVEVGSWDASDDEVEMLGEYLAKGGFLIVDDFRDRQIWNIDAILSRAVPGSQIREIPDDHSIFDAFFRIEDPHTLTSYGFEPPSYLGVYEDDDPDGRLMAILNYNGDMAEYWEYSDYGYLPIDLTNEAYKFGVNYIVYAMTH